MSQVELVEPCLSPLDAAISSAVGRAEGDALRPRRRTGSLGSRRCTPRLATRDRGGPPPLLPLLTPVLGRSARPGPGARQRPGRRRRPDLPVMEGGAGTEKFSNPSVYPPTTIGEARFSEPRQVTCLEEGSRFGLEWVTMSRRPIDGPSSFSETCPWEITGRA